MKSLDKYLYILIFGMLFVNILHAEFTRSFMTMQVTINTDGSALIKNDIRIYMSTSDSIDLYKLSLKTTNDIAGWRERLGLDDVRFYVDTSKVQIEKISIQPTSPDTCNYDQTACYGTLSYQYTVKPGTNNSGLVTVDKYVSPRVIKYTLNPDVFVFDVSPIGEHYIPERTSVEINLPSDVVNVKISPQSAEYIDEIPRGATKFTWQGRLTMTNAELSFERKEPLLSEVVSFFDNLASMISSWLLSLEGIVIITSLLLIWVGYYLLKQQASK